MLNFHFPTRSADNLARSAAGCPVNNLRCLCVLCLCTLLSVTVTLAERCSCGKHVAHYCHVRQHHCLIATLRRCMLYRLATLHYYFYYVALRFFFQLALVVIFAVDCLPESDIHDRHMLMQHRRGSCA